MEKMGITKEQILDKWHKIDDTLELWITKKHALKAMEEYAELKLKNNSVIGDVKGRFYSDDFDSDCSHEFVSREYAGQPNGTCVGCGAMIP